MRNSSPSKCPCLERNKILIVDDDVFNIATLETIMDINFKLKVDKALNGQEAIDKVTKRN